MQAEAENPGTNIVNMKPSFQNEDTREKKHKEIEQLLYHVFSKYFEKKA